MGKEALSLATLEPMSNEYVRSAGTIETVETLEAIASSVCTLNSVQVA
ncbi:MAG: hypothetical protein JO011_14670, partial [Ktedonobacteraceae bacterium]|nr:hypothetical protein [Ktedonobacteraceae bacterium]